MPSEHYPFRILLQATHSDRVPTSTIADVYAQAVSQAGAGDLVGYSALGTGESEGDVPGTYADMMAAVEKSGSEGWYVMMTFEDKTRVACSRGQGGEPTWAIEAQHPSEGRVSDAWMTSMARVATRSVELPGFQRAILRRQPTWITFVPEPPLARTNHVVTTTEQEVAERYEKPDYFWTVWDRVERVGDHRICIRALDDILENHWLSRTYEQTMALVRLACPKRTYYNQARWHEPFKAWWGIGSYHDELGGERALSPVGYDASTKTFELTGFVLDHRPRRDEDGAMHVHIREIYELRQVVKAKEIDGKPVDTVRIVFPFEWMARQERRPLLDAGARVFYSTRDSVDLIEVTE